MGEVATTGSHAVGLVIREHTQTIDGVSFEQSVVGCTEDVPVTEDLRMRAMILALEKSLLEANPEHEGFSPIVNHFAPNVYAREMFLNKDLIVVGVIHKNSHINVLSKGKVLVATEEGVEEITAPATFTSKSMLKRAVYAIEDSVWTTIHPTEKTDIEEIMEDITATSYAALSVEGEQV
jgi:hypothetical protein